MGLRTSKSDEVIKDRAQWPEKCDDVIRFGASEVLRSSVLATFSAMKCSELRF